RRLYSCLRNSIQHQQKMSSHYRRVLWYHVAVTNYTLTRQHLSRCVELSEIFLRSVGIDCILSLQQPSNRTLCLRSGQYLSRIEHILRFKTTFLTTFNDLIRMCTISTSKIGTAVL